MSAEFIGRHDELAAIEAFLDATTDGPRALLLEGEAGIGKTRLWQEGVVRAKENGHRVLAAAPAGSEVQLSLAALGDLLGDAVEEALPQLPPPQRHALEAALLLEESAGRAPDQRAVGLAVVGALRAFAAASPVLVAVDDLQWLDLPSARVLEFALRRLQDEPIGFLAAVRVAPGVEAPFDVTRTLSAVERLRLEPLTVAGVFEVLRARLDAQFSRPTLLRIHEATAGNPFFAIEVGRELLRRNEEPAPGEPLPVPADLADLLRKRLARLPRLTREALLEAAALSSPTIEVLEAADDEPARLEPALEPAVAAAVIDVRDGRIHFSHPLLAAVCYSEASPRGRRVMHRKLAAAVADPEERARHLALAADAPDATVAAALEEAARRARQRGAPDAAAQLFEQAVGLTPPDRPDDVRSRTLLAAELLFVAGDTTRARRILEDAVADFPPGAAQARALLLLARVLYVAEGNEAGAAACERALREQFDDPLLEAELHTTLASYLDHDNSRRAFHAHEALALLEAQEDPEPDLLASALLASALADYYTGKGVCRDLFQRAGELEQARDRPAISWRARTLLASALKYADELAEARELYEEAHRLALEESDESSLPDLLGHLAELELWAGNWPLADRYAAECLDVTVRTGQEFMEGINHYVRAVVDAHLGRVDSARAHAEAGLAHGEPRSAHWAIGINLWVLGFLDLSLGDLAAVDRHLSRADEIGEEIGLLEPGQWRFHADHIEALIGLGELDRAEVLLTRLEQRGRAVDRAWALATAARCRGLLADARGNRDAALAAFDGALAEHERLPMPFERARTLLSRGSVSRRARQKGAARETLGQALATFEELGAPLWAEKARAELGRIGGRAAPRRGELSETERQIAELVTAGKTNQEIALALSLSPRTVQWNLTKVYSKLGVRSRTELARSLLQTTQS